MGIIAGTSGKAWESFKFQVGSTFLLWNIRYTIICIKDECCTIRTLSSLQIAGTICAKLLYVRFHQMRSIWWTRPRRWRLPETASREVFHLYHTYSRIETFYLLFLFLLLFLFNVFKLKFSEVRRAYSSKLVHSVTLAGLTLWIDRAFMSSVKVWDQVFFGRPRHVFRNCCVSCYEIHYRTISNALSSRVSRVREFLGAIQGLLLRRAVPADPSEHNPVSSFQFVCIRSAHSLAFCVVQQYRSCACWKHLSTRTPRQASTGYNGKQLSKVTLRWGWPGDCTGHHQHPGRLQDSERS